MHKLLTLLTTLILIPHLLGCSSSNSISTQQKQKSQLENLIIQANNKVGFNGVVLISKGDEVLFEKAIGKVGENSSDKLTTNYAFSPGSIAKEFSVIALLQLKQMNKINFNQSIADFFPELPDWKHEITIEHLLTHSSGLPDVKYRANMTTIQALDDLKQLKTLNFSPGEKFDYGNNNTILRALVVEKVAGVPFEDYLQDNLFTPAGMSGTFAKSDFKHINRKIALGAISLALKGVTAYTTAKDLFKLEQFLWSKKGLGDSLIESAITKHGKGGQGRAYYDFGFYRKDDSGNVTFIEHDGTYPIHYTLKRTNLIDNFTLILLSNDGRKATLNELRTSIVDYLEQGYLEEPQIWSFLDDINLKGIDYAIGNFKTQVASEKLVANEDQLNTLGYDYFYEGKLETAVKILKLNYDLFSESLNAIDSYAEVLIEAGKTENAKTILRAGLKHAKEKKYDFYIKRFNNFLSKK